MSLVEEEQFFHTTFNPAFAKILVALCSACAIELVEMPTSS
jgi:hypothetical protein